MSDGARVGDVVQAVSVYVTTADVAEAERIGATLVEEGLAACANVLPSIRSIYRWQGAVQRDDEALLLLKTRRALADAACQRVAELHGYDVPCALVLPVLGGLPEYLAWLAEQTAAP